MIIQVRQDSLRLITQHDHGLLSGELAHLWRLPSGQPLSARLVRAIALHDLPWDALDDPERWAPHAQTLPFDHARGRMHDFVSLPSAIKAPLYARGIDALERVDPYVALLLSVHYSAFMPPHLQAFAADERARRARLRRALDVQDEQLAQDYELLKAIDMVSLYLCQCSPGASPQECPSWITPRWTLLGQPLRFEFLDEHTVRLSGARLAAPARFELPWRELTRQPRDAASFLRDWRQAPLKRSTLTILDDSTPDL